MSCGVGVVKSIRPTRHVFPQVDIIRLSDMPITPRSQ
jgi:hypothetical protein